MSIDLTNEIDKIKQELVRLSKEVEKIKDRETLVGEAVTGVGRYEPRDVVALENLMRDMAGEVEEGGALVHAGYLIRDGKRVGIWVNTANMDKWIDKPLQLPAKNIARFLSPFSSEQRIAILRALYEGFIEGKTVSELGEETGFEGGQLYHHLRELERANYVETKEERGRYFISVMGHIALLTVSHMAMVLPSFINKKLGETARDSVD